MIIDEARISEGVEIPMPRELKRLLDFNPKLTQQAFEPVMSEVLHDQWQEFNFQVGFEKRHKSLAYNRLLAFILGVRKKYVHVAHSNFINGYNSDTF